MDGYFQIEKKQEKGKWVRRKKRAGKRRRGWGASEWDRGRQENVMRLEAGNKGKEKEGGRKERGRGRGTEEGRKWTDSVNDFCLNKFFTLALPFLLLILPVLLWRHLLIMTRTILYKPLLLSCFRCLVVNSNISSDCICLTVIHILAFSTGDWDTISSEAAVLACYRQSTFYKSV